MLASIDANHAKTVGWLKTKIMDSDLVGDVAPQAAHQQAMSPAKLFCIKSHAASLTVEEVMTLRKQCSTDSEYTDKLQELRLSCDSCGGEYTYLEYQETDPEALRKKSDTAKCVKELKRRKKTEIERERM